MQTAQPIFQDVHGMAVKFFVQKDIAQEIQTEMCETIAVRTRTIHSTPPLSRSQAPASIL